MDTLPGNTVFIDVEQNPNYILTREICHTDFVASQSAGSAQEMAGQSVEIEYKASVKLDDTSDVNHGETSSACKLKILEGESAAEYNLLKIISRRVQCPECRYTAENEEKMLRHIKKIHKGENPFQCYMCEYSTYNKSLFEEHVRIHQGIKPFECTQCEYKSASKKNLKKHTLVHRKDNPLKCGQCDFIARHNQMLKRHLETHAGGDWLEFDSCKLKFREMAAYKKHEKTHRLKCKQCEFKTCSRPFLKRHMFDEHGLKDELIKKENFTCQICGWSSSATTKILLHLIHHPKQLVDENVIDISILRKHGIMT